MGKGGKSTQSCQHPAQVRSVRLCAAFAASRSRPTWSRRGWGGSRTVGVGRAVYATAMVVRWEFGGVWEDGEEEGKDGRGGWLFMGVGGVYVLGYFGRSAGFDFGGALLGALGGLIR